MTIRATWFGADESPLMGWLHLPADGEVRGAAVICPPVGDEFLSAHGTLRYLAGRLADIGIAAFRFDYRGTGDSAGDERSPDQVAGWIDSVAAAVESMRTLQVPDIALVGMRLGATLAAVAAERCQPLAGLLLWDPCESGGSFLREQRALHRMSIGRAFDESDGSVEALGIAYSPSTVADLQRLTLPAFESGPFARPGDAGLRLLVLTRSDRPVPARVKALIELPDVRHAKADGQRQLLDLRRSMSTVPVDDVATVVRQLSELMPAARFPVALPPVRLQAVVSRDAERPAVVERIAYLGATGMFAVVAEPTTPPASTVLFLNTLEHHVGPNRMWVEMAREGAAAGLRMVRFDRVGLGESAAPDSLEDPLPYDAASPADVRDAVAALAVEGAEAADGGVALVGMCAGAWAASMAAPVLAPRAVYLVNQVAWRDDPGFTRARELAVVAPASWRSDLRATLRARLPYFVVRLTVRFGLANVPETQLARLVGTGAMVTLIFSADDRRDFARQRGDDAMRRLRRQGRHSPLRLIELPEADHNLMYRPARGEVARRLTELFIDDLVRTGWSQVHSL